MNTFAEIPEDIEKGTVEINGMTIFYCRSGTGSHPVLLIPGSIGVAWDDYKHQLRDLDQEKFTLVLMHPPGLGKSRPPDRTLPDNYLQRDATVAYTLMKKLGYSKYSLIGWLNGATISLVLASMYPENVQKIVVSNCKVMITEDDVKSYTAFKNVDDWHPSRLDPLVAIYGKEYLKCVWTTFVNKMVEIHENKDGNLCREVLPDIRAPVLVLHGEDEKMSKSSHAYYIVNHLKNAKLHIFENGEHNMHVKNYEKFNAMATEFLLEP